MFKKIIVQLIFIFVLIFPYELAKSDLCQICLVDECYATYEIEPDYDCDGMKYDLEIQLTDLCYFHS